MQLDIKLEDFDGLQSSIACIQYVSHVPEHPFFKDITRNIPGLFLHFIKLIDSDLPATTVLAIVVVGRTLSPFLTKISPFTGNLLLFHTFLSLLLLKPK